MYIFGWQVLIWRSWKDFVERQVAKSKRASLADLHWSRRMLRNTIPAWVDNAQTGRIQQQAAATICASIMRRVEVGVYPSECLLPGTVT